jgi:FkbM family methyltransferase
MTPTMSSLRSAAERVLSSVPEGVTRGEIPAGLYGLGFLGRWALPRLKNRAVKLVYCYDANEALTGSIYEGVPVYAASDLKSSAPEFLIVTARHVLPPVSEMLCNLGIAYVSYDAWFVASNFPAFRRVHDFILRDERSKAVLRAVMMAMLTGDKKYCAAVFEKDQYFCLPRFCGSEKDLYVDAGAFCGDSAERFIWAHNGIFSKIYAFEPGARQFAALKARTRRLIEEWALDSSDIELINAGLGQNDCVMPAISPSGQMTNLALGYDSGTAETNADIVSLDSFLKGDCVTFLKADVEGMEMQLLQGAQSTIRRYQPKISICVYHYPNDIPDITNYLADLVPDYQFALRHHSPQLMETVLYCWID